MDLAAVKQATKCRLACVEPGADETGRWMQARLSLKRTNRAPGVVGVVREPRTSFGCVAFTEAATRLVNRGVFIVIITNLITLWYLDFPSRFCAPADQSVIRSALMLRCYT